MITLYTSKIYIKNVNFGDKKIKKSGFYKNQKVTRIDEIDANKILISKEEPTTQNNHLNTLLDTMILTLLDLYA